VERGTIKGVILAPRAPRLTHALYADDVILMGEATETEARDIIGVLYQFDQHSGLVVNLSKSVIWFSMTYGEECKGRILDVIQAKIAGDKEKYLGIYLPNKARGKD
jgi:hypothetical protein